MNKPLMVLGAALAGSAILAGCSSNGSGGGSNAPDEFRVVRKAPLTIPPDYNLRPPAPGEARPQECILMHDTGHGRRVSPDRQRLRKTADVVPTLWRRDRPVGHIEPNLRRHGEREIAKGFNVGPQLDADRPVCALRFGLPLRWCCEGSCRML